MASVADMQLQVDVRLGLDGPCAEAVALLGEYLRRLDDRECSRQCTAPSGGCYCVRVAAFLSRVEAMTDPKGAK